MHADWQFYVLFLLLLISAYLVFVFDRALIQMFRTTIRLNFSEESFRTNELSSSILNIFMQLIFVFSLAYFSYWYLTENKIFIGQAKGILYTYCVCFFMLIYIIKNIFLWLLSIIFPFGQDVSFYRFNVNVLNQTLGFILIPLLFLLTYTYVGIKEYVMWLVIALFILTLVFRYVRLFMIAFKYIKFYKFYFFIYFCTSEIIPNLVLIKIFYSL
ncbi:MAG TPA: DUF4271 domain-containing protein [Bacteroidetes bacterium]|nr:DUF4271 domain-containing protein [Bacteroidota bacterium]